jgi:hypothetical protein
MQAPTADSLRQVLDSVFTQRKYAWVEPPAPLRLLGRWWEALRDWLTALREGNPALFQLFVYALLAVLVAILVHAGYVTWMTLRQASATESARAPVRRGPTRDAAWYQRQADRLAVEGCYLEALQHAFAALALRLDARGVLRFHPSKTPQEYTREARLPATERGRLRALVGSLYTFSFGGAPCGPDDYRRWQAEASAEWHEPAR